MRGQARLTRVRAKPKHLEVRNWERFQHYRDRKPIWIKFHIDMLDDTELRRLPYGTRLLWDQLLLLAGRCENRIPNDVDEIAAMTRIDVDTVRDGVQQLTEGRWIKEAKRAPARTEKWASRYVSQETRERVFAAADHSCVRCKSKTNLEIDHVVPISKGGTGAEDNLQVLCRSCNRAKRVTVAEEQPATQNADLRSPRARPRARGEAEAEKEKDLEADGSKTTPDPAGETNGLPTEKDQLLNQLLSEIGDDADEGTRFRLQVLAQRVPPASLAKVRESLQQNKPLDRAAYAVGALQSEFAERAAKR